MYRTHLTQRSERRGFTLVELLLVIAILGILAAAVVVNFAGQTVKAQIRRTAVDIAAIEQALEMFELEVGRFPSQSEGLAALIDDPGVPGWGGPYLKQKTNPKDPWGNEYQYDPEGTRGPFYDVFSYGPDGVEGTDDDLGNWEAEAEAGS